MNLEATKEVLYDLTEMFFQKATVLWVEQMNTKPKLPYITMKTNGISKSAFPVEDDELNRYYQCETTLELNLYTQGRPVTVGKNVTGNYANTVTSDLLDFFKFIESDIMTDYLAGKGVEISLKPPVRDLSDLQNGTSYRYRSMAEATVKWTEEANGPYGIGGMDYVPNYSGGGTEEMANAEFDIFDSAEIEIKEESNNG